MLGFEVAIGVFGHVCCPLSKFPICFVLNSRGPVSFELFD
jgi:hypothetical protein